MSREWTKEDEDLLFKSEKFLTTARLMFGTIDLWTDTIGTEIEPQDLPLELRQRVTQVMWQVAMLQLIINEDGPAQAFHAVVSWVQEMNPDMIRIQEVSSPEEFDRLTKGFNGNGKEGKAAGGYL